MIVTKFHKDYVKLYGEDILAQLSEDELKCRCCHTKKSLTIHHILPRKEGGTDNVRNLIVLCWDCHNKAELEELSYKQYANGYLRPLKKVKRIKVKMYKMEGENMIYLGERYQ